MTIGLDCWLRFVAASAFPAPFDNQRPGLGRLPFCARDLAGLNLPEDIRARLEAWTEVDTLRRRWVR